MSSSRVADEFVVDIKVSVGGARLGEAKADTRTIGLRGVPMPFASPELLYRVKQTLRERDKLDILFMLESLKKKH